jgi:hypothetical protein
MRLRIIIGFFTLAIVCSAHAQWIDIPPDSARLPGRAGIGGPIHASARLRLTEEAPGVLSIGPFHLTFGSTASMWWGFRLDAGNHLHLDRDSDTGWAEGFVFKRDGNFGIGVDPLQIFHAVKDQNAPTMLRVSNASTGNAAYTGTQYSEGSLVKAEIRSIGSGFPTAAGGANAFHLWNIANAPTVFATNNAERMRINADGTVGLNFPSVHSSRLIVQHGTDNSSALFLTHQPSVEANATQDDKGLSIQTTENVHAGFTNSGAVFGSHSWTHLTGAGTLSKLYGAFIETGSPTGNGTVNNSYGLYLHSVRGGTGTVGNGYGAYVGDVLATNDYAFYQAGADDTNYFAGNLVIGGSPAAGAKLSVAGDIVATGSVTGVRVFNAVYQDIAEWVPASEDMVPGTVVVLSPANSNEVMPSARPYDTAVAGVVSAQPGVLLGVGGASKEQIATTGRVKVRVDATAAPVRIGDLLVTRDLPGTAMKSIPIALGDAQIHRPGTIVGKALEPLDAGVGEILVLLSLQ